MDKSSLPLVHSTKSNLINNYRVLNASPGSIKSHEVRFRGSMFVNMLNNIKQNMINRNQRTNKNKSKNQQQQHHQKITLEVRQYYMSRKTSKQNIFSTQSSIKNHADHIHKTFHTRHHPKNNQNVKIPLTSLCSHTQSNVNSHAPSLLLKKNPNNNPFLKKQIIQQKQFIPKCQNNLANIPKNLQAKSVILRRWQFHELPETQWAIIIPEYMLNYRWVDKYENLFSDILFEGVDLIIRLEDYGNLKQIPTQLRQLCHIMYVKQRSIDENSAYLFVTIPQTPNKPENSKYKQQQLKIPQNILSIDQIQQNFLKKWLYTFPTIQTYRICHIKIDDILKIKNIWINIQNKSIRMQYCGHDICEYLCERDRRLDCQLVFERQREKLGEYVRQQSQQKQYKQFEESQKNSCKEQFIKKLLKQLQEMFQKAQNKQSTQQHKSAINSIIQPNKPQKKYQIANNKLSYNYQPSPSCSTHTPNNNNYLRIYDQFQQYPLIMIHKKSILKKNPQIFIKQFVMRNSYNWGQIRDYLVLLGRYIGSQRWRIQKQQKLNNQQYEQQQQQSKANQLQNKQLLLQGQSHRKIEIQPTYQQQLSSYQQQLKQLHPNNIDYPNIQGNSTKNILYK